MYNNNILDIETSIMGLHQILNEQQQKDQIIFC